MPLVDTSSLVQGERRSDNLQIYCGLDTMITTECKEEIHRLHPHASSSPVYAYERAMQGPVLEMCMRGFRMDRYAVKQGIKDTEKKIDQVQYILDRLAASVWGKGLNPRSTPQLVDFFYSHLNLPEKWVSKKGVRRLAMDRDVLEDLYLYFHARPFVACILKIRELEKVRQVLTTEVDSDGRMRTTYSIGGTETWRFSSYESAGGTGTNVQNITENLRHCFIADPGWKLCVIDGAQAEARDVGWICFKEFGDPTYLDAVESGDLHTLTAKLIWPEKVFDRASADLPFYRHFSYRDMSKRGGHGTTYLGTPWTMAHHLKVDVALMELFQDRFFAAFKAIPNWHTWVASQLQLYHSLSNAFGFTRHFFGRVSDKSTIREAVAFAPQSSTAIRTNLGLLRHWLHFRKDTQILGQTHDSMTFQYREEKELDIIPTAIKCMEDVVLDHKGRTFFVPGEAKIGWNWQRMHDPGKPLDAKSNPFNPQGLLKWKGKRDERKCERIMLS